MTTIEKLNCSSKLLRPTDLSLKNNHNSRLRRKSLERDGGAGLDNRRHVIVHAQPEFKKQQKAVADERALWSERVSSPIALVFGRGNFAAVTTMTATSPALDTRLVVLDSLFPPHNGATVPSPVSSVFESLSKHQHQHQQKRNGRASNVQQQQQQQKQNVECWRSNGQSVTTPHQSSGRSSNGPSPYSSAEHAQEQQHQPQSQQQQQQQLNTPHTIPARAKSRSPKSASPSSPPTPVCRGTKRKGGWKFHDLSDESDGLGRRKRAYSHNKLENEILQLYQDRVCIKEVPSGVLAKSEHLVVIEPSYISDPDLVKYNTGLRIVFDKKQGTYQLQILPYTIEQGALSNKNAVLGAVAKMLGDNGSVLCPGIARALLSPQVYLPQHAPETTQPWKTPKKGGRGSNMNSKSSSDDCESDKYWGRWKMFHGAAPESGDSPESGNESGGTPVTPTDRLLLTLNKELMSMSQQNRITAASTNASDGQLATRCLLWHTPLATGKGKKAFWPTEAKWCTNCVRRMLKQ